MNDLIKKYIVVYNENNEIILKEIENNGRVFPGAGTLFFETNDLQEFEQFIIDNNLIEINNF